MPFDPNDKSKVLYDAISHDYDLGTYDEFKTKLQDPNKRKALYDAIGNEYDLGDYNSFNQKLGFDSKEVQKQTQPQLTNPAGVEVADLNKIANMQVGQPKYPDAYQVKQQEIAKTNKAVDNHVNKLAKEYQITDPHEVQKLKENTVKLYNNDKLVLDKDHNGEPVLKEGAGFGESFTGALKHTSEQSDENAYLFNAPKDKAIEYLNRTKEQPETGIVKEETKAPSGFLGEAGKFLGENLEGLSKGIVGAVAGASSELTGGASMGTFLAMAKDFAHGGYSQGLKQNYYTLKQQNPNISDEEAFEKAQKAALANEAVSLTTGAVLSKAVPTEASEGLLGAIDHSIKTSPKVLGTTAAGSVAGDVAGIGVGEHKDVNEILGNATEATQHMAVLHFGLGVLPQVIKSGASIPFGVKSQAENVVSYLPREEVKSYYENAENNGEIPQGTTEKIIEHLNGYDKHKEVVADLEIPEEQKAIIASRLNKPNEKVKNKPEEVQEVQDKNASPIQEIETVPEVSSIAEGEVDKTKQENKVGGIEIRKNALPEYQPNTRTEATRAILDYFAEVTGREKYSGDINKGDYISWLGDDKLGTEVKYKLNQPREAFDIITKYVKELAELKKGEVDKTKQVWKAGETYYPMDGRPGVTIKSIVKVFDNGDTKVEFTNGTKGMIMPKDVISKSPQYVEEPATQSNEISTIDEAIKNFKEGDDNIYELVDNIEAISDDTNNAQLQDAVKYFRDEQEYDRKVSGRHDMDMVEKNFIDRVRKAQQQPTTEKGLEVSSIAEGEVDKTKHGAEENKVDGWDMDKDISLSDILPKNKDGQNIEDAISNVKDGLTSRSEGNVLVYKNGDKYEVGDGFHRIAEAMLRGDKTIKADVKLETESKQQLLEDTKPQQSVEQKYSEHEVEDFAKKSKFKVSKSNDYTYFNIGEDKQIRISSRKVKGVSKGYRVTVHEGSGDGYTYNAEHISNEHAETLQEAKRKAAKIYFNEIRKDVDHNDIDISDKQIDYSKVPTDELKKIGEKTNNFSEMAAIKKELDKRKNQPTEAPQQQTNKVEQPIEEKVSKTLNVNKTVANKISEIASNSKDFNNFKEQVKEILTKNGKETSNKEQTSAANANKGSTKTGKSNPEEKIKVLKKRAKPEIKSPLYKKALNTEDESPRSQVLKYFINGGKIHTDALKQLFGNKRGKNIQGEINSKLQLRGKDAPKTIDELAHKLWDNSSEEIQSKYDSQDFRNAVEDVLQSHNSRTSMAQEMVKTMSEDEQAMSDWYDKTYSTAEKLNISEEDLSHSIDILQGLSDEEIQKIANEQANAYGDYEYINKVMELHGVEESGNKVVDANGEPKIVFHETNADFAEFSNEMKGTGHGNDFGGIWFSDKKGYFSDSKKTTKEANIIIKNPATDAELTKAQLELPESLYKDKNGKSRWYNKWFTNKGYDGLILKGGEYAVFDKSQIKLVAEQPKEEVNYKEAYDDAKNNYNKALADLRKAEDNIAQKQATQTGMFGETAQKEMFGVNRDEAKDILDPLKTKVKEAKAALDQADKNWENAVSRSQPTLDIPTTDRKKVSDQIRDISKKIKGSDPNALYSDITALPRYVVGKALDIVADAIDAGETIANAIAKGAKHLMDKAKESKIKLSKDEANEIVSNELFETEYFNNKLKELYTDLTQQPGPQPKSENIVPPQEPKVEVAEASSGKTVGASHESLTKLADDLGLPKPERGDVLTPEEYTQRGQELVKNGADPIRAAEEFKKDGKVNAEMISVARAHLVDLVKDAEAARVKFGKNSKEFKEATSKVNDWSRDVVKPMGTAFGETGRALQGETDIDTGNFVSVQRAFVETNGKPMTPAQEAQAESLTKKVSDLSKEVDGLKQKLSDALDKATEAEKKAGKIFTEKAKRIANNFRKLKQREFKFTDENGNEIDIQQMGIGWNDLVELGAKSIEKTGEIADGIAEIVDKIKDAEWYKNLSDKDKAALAQQLTTHFESAKNETTQVEDLAERFADKKDSKFSMEDAKDIWDYAKKEYIDKGSDFDDMIDGVAADLGLKREQVGKALTTPKGAKVITDEMYKKQYQRNQAKKYVESWVKSSAETKEVKFLKAIPRFFFAAKVFGHGTVGMITHAGVNIADPVEWKRYWPIFFKQFKLAYGSTADYERTMQNFVRDKDYILWKRSGLAIDPTHRYDDYQFISKIFDKMGTVGKWLTAGDRGFNALKLYRLEMAKARFDKLSATEKADPNTAKQIAQLVNHATGTTKLKVSEVSNAIFFAPNLEFARWNKFIVDPAKATKTLANWGSASSADKAAAKIVFARAGRILATYASALAANQALLSLSGSQQKINYTDPSQSDWMKFKVGGRTVDVTGMLTLVGFLGKLFNTTTESQEELGKNNRSEAVMKTGWNYVTGKFSPFASTAKDVLTHHDFSGNTLPMFNDKPLRSYNKKLTWGEYLSQQQTPIPVAEAFHDIQEHMEEQGVSKATANQIMGGILMGAIVGGTGAHVGEEPFAKAIAPQFSEEDKKSPAFKFFLDKGLTLPNTSLKYEKITDEKNHTKKSVADYSKDIQDKYNSVHKANLKTELSKIIQRGYVYVKHYTDADGKAKNEVSINHSEGSKKEMVSKLGKEDLAQILSLAQSQATKKTKEKIFK